MTNPITRYTKSLVGLDSVTAGVVIPVNIDSITGGLVFPVNIDSITGGVVIPVTIDSITASVTFLTKTYQNQALSTAVTLAGSGTYASATIDVRDYNNVVGTCFADQNGTLFLEYSPNGTNWDAQEAIPYNANTQYGFKSVTVAPNFRVRFVNGATPQTIFRLYCFGKY